MHSLLIFINTFFNSRNCLSILPQDKSLSFHYKGELQHKKYLKNGNFKKD